MSSQDQEPRNSILPPWPSTIYHLLLAAIWVSAFLPEARLWGLNWYRYFGWPGLTILAVVGLAAPWVIDRLTQKTNLGLPSKAGGRTYSVAALVTIVIFGIGFVLLVGRTHFLGDGYQVLGKLQAGAEVIKPWDHPVWTVQKALYLLVGGSGEADARLALRILSIGSGIVLLMTLVVAAWRLFEDNLARMFMVLSLATGGYMLLFFGYLENYPLFVLCVMVFGLTGLMVTRTGLSRWWILAPLVPALVLHPFGVSLLPAAIFLLGWPTHLARWLSECPTWTKWTSILIGGAIAFMGVAYAWQTSLFFRFSLVPPVADQFTVEGYTLFSTNHILDYANLLIMLCPGLLLALVLLTRLSVRSTFRRPEYRFLGLLTLTALVVVFMFNPRLGMPRDWDLFAFAGVPLMLLCTLIVLEKWNDSEIRISGWLMIVLGLLILGPRVVGQARPEVSIAVFDYFADLDVIKSRNGRFLLQEYLKKHNRMTEHARRSKINTLVLPYERLAEQARRLGEEGYLAEAAAKFRRALALDPTYHYAWSNLGVVYRLQNQYDSALICLHIADGLNPYSFSTHMKLGGTYSGAGNDSRAEWHWQQAAHLMPADLESRLYLLRLYRKQARWDELDTLLADVVARDSLSLEILEPVARRQLETGDTAAGAASCRQALKLGLDTVVIVTLQQEFPLLQVIDPDWTGTNDTTGQ